MTRPVHPGEILRHDFMIPLGLDVVGLASKLCLPETLVRQIINQDCPMSSVFAERIVAAFGGDVQSWLNLQFEYDLHLTTPPVTKEPPQ